MVTKLSKMLTYFYFLAVTYDIYCSIHRPDFSDRDAQFILKQVTQGHNIVANGWAGASSPHPNPTTPTSHTQTECIYNICFSSFQPDHHGPMDRVGLLFTRLGPSVCQFGCYTLPSRQTPQHFQGNVTISVKIQQEFSKTTHW